jgi:hypothetical protein
LNLSFCRLLFSQPLIFSAEPFEFRLVLVDLPLLVILPSVLRHELIANQCAGDKSNRSADERADGGMSDGAADNGARSSTDTSTDETALFAFREWL